MANFAKSKAVQAKPNSLATVVAILTTYIRSLW